MRYRLDYSGTGFFCLLKIKITQFPLFPDGFRLNRILDILNFQIVALLQGKKNLVVQVKVHSYDIVILL